MLYIQKTDQWHYQKRWTLVFWQLTSEIYKKKTIFYGVCIKFIDRCAKLMDHFMIRTYEERKCFLSFNSVLLPVLLCMSLAPSLKCSLFNPFIYSLAQFPSTNYSTKQMMKIETISFFLRSVWFRRTCKNGKWARKTVVCFFTFSFAHR